VIRFASEPNSTTRTQFASRSLPLRGQLKLAGPRERARGQFEGVKDNNLRNNPGLYRAVRDNSRKRGGARLLAPERKAVLNYVGQLLDFALGGDWYFGYFPVLFVCDEQCAGPFPRAPCRAASGSGATFTTGIPESTIQQRLSHTRSVLVL